MAEDKEELKRLRRQLDKITVERDGLLAENRRLYREFGKPRKSKPINQSGLVSTTSDSLATGYVAVNNESPLSEKSSLFRFLFRGREDVFARQWWSTKSQKIGYSPLCNREWNRTWCGKPRIKCGDCTNSDFASVTDDVIRDHLEGRHTMGVYPLLLDETCYLLAVDFDKQSWMEDAAAYLETCHQMDIPAVLERSRSGNGAHIWIFFSEAVPAEKNNTLFLDENFSPYEDQWAFLSSITRMGLPHLDEVVREATRTGQIIGVRASSTDEEERPWAMPPSRRLWETPPIGTFPAEVRIVMGNLVYVDKQELPSSLLNRIKRLAAFQNPKFYKKQNLRLSTALTPRVICCAEDFTNHLAVPRGCLGELQELLESAGIKVDILDERFQGTNIDIGFHGQLTSMQERAVTDLARYDEGILVAPSGSGKTVVGIYMIAARRRNALVLVHRRPVLEQWRAQLASFLEVDPAMIGHIGGGKGKRTGLIDVAMLQSLIRKNQVDDIVAGYGQVIIDECHHLPAVTFEQVLRQVKARYIIGLTATPYRRDGQQLIILMQCGPVRHTLSQKDRQSQDMLRHHLICRDTSFTTPIQEGETSIHNIYAALVADAARNELILNDLLRVLEEGRSPILLTERREHLEFFTSRLAKSGTMWFYCVVAWGPSSVVPWRSR